MCFGQLAAYLLSSSAPSVTLYLSPSLASPGEELKQKCSAAAISS